MPLMEFVGILASVFGGIALVIGAVLLVIAVVCDHSDLGNHISATKTTVNDLQDQISSLRVRVGTLEARSTKSP